FWTIRLSILVLACKPVPEVARPTQERSRLVTLELSTLFRKSGRPETVLSPDARVKITLLPPTEPSEMIRLAMLSKRTALGALVKVLPVTTTPPGRIRDVTPVM